MKVPCFLGLWSMHALPSSREPPPPPFRMCCYREGVPLFLPPPPPPPTVSGQSPAYMSREALNEEFGGNPRLFIDAGCFVTVIWWRCCFWCCCCFWSCCC